MSEPSSQAISKRPWHTRTADQVLQELKTNADSGLSQADAQTRLREHGDNELAQTAGRSVWSILWGQLSSTMVLILIAAAVLSGFLGKTTETLAIAAIVVLFTLLGFIQEHRAERAMAALKQMSKPTARVRRDGQLVELPSAGLVPGDVVVLEAGDLVPADVRWVETQATRAQEAALTGESEPVEKHTAALDDPEAPLGDRHNLGFMGTAITYGRGAAVVTDTGMRTQLGRIAELIQSVKPSSTPLQQRLDKLGKALALAGVTVAALVMGIGLLRGEPLSDMLLTAVSVAVAVVPEGLPAVVTLTLALGAQRMLRRRALIRQLPAVETLGSVTTICSDKTGTLTQNRMTVTTVEVAGQRFDLTPPDETTTPQALDLQQAPAQLAVLLGAAALCNDASVNDDGAAVGDPTETALIVAAEHQNLHQVDLNRWFPRAGEHPFDSERKRMSTWHRLSASADETLPQPLQALHDGKHTHLMLVKGALDSLLGISTHAWTDTGVTPLTAELGERLERANEELAGQGLRVLSVALRWLDSERDASESDLVFVGLLGMLDPPRPEVKRAVSTCIAAGVRPIMITGDHPSTARFIAQDLGLCNSDQVMTGRELARLSAPELSSAVREVSVFARVSPEHKLRIVECLQQSGEVVAMTGDGVNDSPALRKADVGVAMGVTGTDVSKEASEVVLLDDNFATIVAAVEEGRVIYANVQRFVKFSIAGNLGKVLVMLLAPLGGITVALLPLQLLWLNLLTDGLLGLGLGLEPPNPNVMRRPPRAPDAPFFPRWMLRQLLWVGALIGVLALGIGLHAHSPGASEGARWQTLIFTSLAFLQVGQALGSRSSISSLFQQGVTSNRPLLVLVILTVLLQLMVLYVPFFRPFFQVEPLKWTDLLCCIALGAILFGALELEKWWLRKRAPDAPLLV